MIELIAGTTPESTYQRLVQDREGLLHPFLAPESTGQVLIALVERAPVT
jgi:hypothetical protein